MLSKRKIAVTTSIDWKAMKQSAIITDDGIWQCIVCSHEYSAMDYWNGNVRWTNCPQCGISNKLLFEREYLIRKQADWHIDGMLGARDDDKEISD